MTESPLKLSISWKTQFVQASRMIDDGQLDGAMPILKQALAIIDQFDAIANEDRRDSRAAQTLERIAYLCHQAGMLKEAEMLYREALEILDQYMLVFEIREKTSLNLAQLLIETGRQDEGQALLAKYPPREETENAPTVVAHEFEMMSTLSTVGKMMNGSPEVASLMAQLASVAKRFFGTKSTEWTNITGKFGYSAQADMDPSAPLLTRDERFALLLPLAEKAAAFVGEVENEESHPLFTICILAEKSRLHKAMGDIPMAKAVWEEKMQIIARHWGEGHIMMVEAHEEYELLCKL
ncbi:MAG: tetratricopeptide repeat protein [Candidatus Melainabacteria bacterium]|nr:tetratricopeptide repeat protein [Candidatus Melainabacteria bacterium]